jgi:hypothetical protein
LLGMTLAELACSYNVSHSTISRLAAQILCPRLPSNRTVGEVFSPRQIYREIKSNPAPANVSLMEA